MGLLLVGLGMLLTAVFKMQSLNSSTPSTPLHQYKRGSTPFTPLRQSKLQATNRSENTMSMATVQGNHTRSPSQLQEPAIDGHQFGGSDAFIQMAGDKLKGLPQDALLQRVLQVFPHTCGELLLKAKVDSRCADVDRLTNCKGLYAFSKYAWALTCDYPADDVGTEGYAGNATSANNTRQVVVKVRKALQTVEDFQMEATIMCEMMALRRLGIMDTLNGIADYLVCPSIRHGQDLRSATLSLRKSAKKQRIQKEPIKWGAFVVTDFAQRMISDLVPVPLLFEVVYTVLAIPLVLHIDPMDVGSKHWHTRLSPHYRQYTVDNATCVLPPGIGLLLIDYGVYQCHNQSDRATTAELMYHLHLNEIKVHESGKQLLALVRSEAFLNISASKAALRYLISECVAMGLFKAEPPPKAKVRTFSIPDPTVVQNLRTTFSQYPCHRRNLGLRAPGAGLAAGGGAAGG
uniref:Non-specific serine/threonine protein kinase n=1 Tax=Eutreptiella gymnastica TaxID=73025 RepID=A0A7S4G3Z9_9EUGL